ncbi:tRNA pseudouridine(13) synthase TruD [Vibrio sp. JC009]|uniref:tRNA pseudouridine(13) synthase TruD n=1 Tax=Vibrio sp. JC009 TaxID=2912314 RepID=UPI0023B00EF6|nr:tRNA pseudouridine(13) synthase TruD [Vibrio sp. JC009]WED21377.1 tRNA pseudouridine(13) synthase TruD [Vibrio sp. JC009]
MTDILSDLAYLHGEPVSKATIKTKPEDFVVKEVLGYEFTGSGEHLMVRIRKTGENTTFVANEIARVCGVKSKDVSWAGLKDRHAVTEQWLSIHLPKGDAPDFSVFEAQYPSIQILETTRHNKKLRPGDLSGNEFELTLRDVTEVAVAQERIEKILQEGVPNYFGAQRFGRDGNNLTEARRWGRENVRTRNQNKRSMYLSTARSWIFNHIVSNRIESELFETLVSGDIIRSPEQSSILVEQESIASYQEQLNTAMVELTALLAGDNELPTQDKAKELEQAVVDSEPDLMALIRGNRMRHDRREILLKPDNLSYVIDGNNIKLSFSLSSGSFATAIVREIAQVAEAERSYS